MPFTLAHTAAAFPLRRVRLVWSALLIGTLAPDFEYFLRLAPDDGYGHTLRGTFLLTLPVSLAVLWLFHKVVKAPVVELLPLGIRSRLVNDLGEFRFGGASRFAMIVVSILVGVLTHLVWDSFTHANTWLYRHWPALHVPAKLPILGATPIYKLFQHGSTAFGIGVLLIWLLVWYRKTEPHPEAPGNGLSRLQRLILTAAIISVGFVGAVIRAILALGLPTSNLAQKRFVGLWITTLIALLWWQLVFYGAWRKKRAKMLELPLQPAGHL
jgi:Domain of unknown function (DUF4184)